MRNSGLGDASQSEEDFQKLLLELSRAAFQCRETSQLIASFCARTRAFFHAGGAYYWSWSAEGELVGAEADGEQAQSFRGMRQSPGEPSIAMDAVHRRRAFYVNRLEAARYPWLAQARANAAMAAPLLVSGKVVGAIAFVHTTAGADFDDGDVAQITILAAQLGTALEALRLKRLAREEHRRASVLVEVASALHGLPDTAAVVENLADRLRVLLHSPAVLVFVQQEKQFELQAVSTETPRLGLSIRSRFQQNQLRSALEIATRAAAAGERITVSIGASHLGEGSAPGVLIAAPFRTSRSHGAILVYPRPGSPFTEEDKTLVSALAGFGAVAIANAELCGMARAQAHELHEILEISFELGSAGKLDEFMQASVVRASSFLGFRRCFIGLLEEAAFHIRWGVENGAARPVDIPITEGVATRALRQKNVFVTEDAAATPGANLDFVAAFRIRQLLAVPLIGSGGDVLGMFGVLDRVEAGPINEDDVRRARALAAQVAIALELTRNLHKSEEHGRRAEALVTIVLELNTVLHLPEFMRNFAVRAAGLLGGRSVALSLFQNSEMDTVLIRGIAEGGGSGGSGREGKGSEVNDPALLRRFSQAMGAALPKYSSEVAFAPADDMLGTALASTLEWTDCTLVRLVGSTGDIVGVLCLADRGAPPDAEDRQLLRAVAGHASIALENACLFTRMQHANRHWLEVFDAISDFIVVHDEQCNVLRVNRSLADFVGIAPEQLIGVNMRALEALSTGASPHSCPFCRGGEGLDEYVHPVLERTYLISTSRIHAAGERPPSRGLGAMGRGEIGTSGAQQLQTVHVLKDITDRREAELRYRELFDNIQEGIFFSTPQGRFVEVNDALVRILGYSSREEVIQLDIPSEVYFSPRRREELAELFEREGGLHNQEEILRRKDGSPVHVFINCFAVRDPNGNVLQYRGLMLDITGLRQSQTELQRERDFSGKVLSHTQSLILVTDTDGVISYANRRWSGFGFRQNQILGHPFPELCVPPRRAALREALAKVAGGQQVDNFDLPLVRGDGASGQFSVNLSPILGEDGRVSSIVVVMTDVTDSAVLRAKLVHAEKMAAVGQLVSGVAHEVNNPLTAILGFTDLLMENSEIPESARRDLRVILQEAQRTKQIVQNLLSFARQMPPQRQLVQLNSILQRTLHLRSYDFISHGIDVVEHLDPSLPDVMGDSHQLQQVFLNILNNAYDAVREGEHPPHPARIEIRSKQDGGFVEISFSDNGVGIADPERIFDPFFTTKDVGHGTGLGLSICYGIVREHGGEILCHNNPDSKGATFIVRLPVVSEAASFGAVAGDHPK